MILVLKFVDCSACRGTVVTATLYKIQNNHNKQLRGNVYMYIIKKSIITTVNYQQK